MPEIRLHQGHSLPEGLDSPDVYFLPGYGHAASVPESGEWILLEAFDGAWQMPLIVRTLAEGAKDAISPYGYSGIYASPTLSPLQVEQAWTATIGCLRETGVISVLLRHSPLVPQPAGLPGLRPIISDHPTVVLEPTDHESAWSSMAGTCRTATRKAVKNGYTGEVREATGQDLAPDGDFRRLYEQTMQRRDAAPGYYFSSDYYDRLLAGLGPKLVVSLVRDQTGAVASAGLLLRHGLRLHGHLGGSTFEDARLGANNLLAWHEIQFAVDQGLHQYHLGGGLSERDDLFRFKRKFGGRELQYSVSGLVIDQFRYQAQTQKRAETLKIPTETLSSSLYFPAYRGGAPRV